MGNQTRKQRTKRLAVSAMLAALGTVVLGLGSLLGDLDLTAAALASILCVYAVIELGGAYPWMIWAVTLFLSLLLPSNKYPALFYIFVGIYPMIKEKLERLPRIPSLLLKLVYFHLCIPPGWGLLRLFAPAEALISRGWLLLGTYVLALAAFLLFDFSLTKLITYYLVKLRSRLGLK